MKDLNSTKALVQTILEKNQQARNSDSYLYLQVIKTVAKEYCLDLSKITITDFLLDLPNSEFPPFESVRRSRQKLQRAFPHLQACEEVNELRELEEETYLEFARS